LLKEYYTDFLKIIKVYITISKLLLISKENRACDKKELKHKLKNLGKVRVQKSIRKRFDNIHKKFDAFINKKIRKQLNQRKVFCYLFHNIIHFETFIYFQNQYNQIYKMIYFFNDNIWSF